MRVVVQRVRNASVTVDGEVTGKIDNGILAYVGFDIDDDKTDINWVANKLPNLRIFNDSDNKMNLSVVELNYGILVISQFTLLGSCKKGRRPSFDRAAKPEIAKKMYDEFIDTLKDSDIDIQTGVFQAHMDVKYVNDGPITIIIDSKE